MLAQTCTRNSFNHSLTLTIGTPWLAFTWCFCANILPHSSQLYGFSPVWTRSWFRSCWLLMNRLVQKVQGNLRGGGGDPAVPSQPVNQSTNLRQNMPLCKRTNIPVTKNPPNIFNFLFPVCFSLNPKVFTEEFTLLNMVWFAYASYGIRTQDYSMSLPPRILI